jgi:hypothetical protein
MRNFYLLPVLASVFLAGCVSDTSLYYWGRAMNTRVGMVREPGEKSTDAHRQELMEVVAQSAEQSKSVPPGVYCELGYMFFKEGKIQDALRYYELEEQLYPESRVFMARLKAKAREIEQRAATP